jgi:hypothetical protein
MTSTFDKLIEMRNRITEIRDEKLSDWKKYDGTSKSTKGLDLACEGLDMAINQELPSKKKNIIK